MKIAIQGHPTRGEEVIKLLESLGGKNSWKLKGSDKTRYYYISGYKHIDLSSKHTFVVESKYYTLEEFEKELPFKIGDKVIHDYDSDSIGTVVDIKFDDNIPYRVNIKGTICTCGKNTLKPYKMTNSRNITLTLDKAREWYNKGGELREIALQAFTKEELNPLPKSWEEYCKGYQVPVMIFGPNISKKYVALWKLEQLRDCYRQGWKPDWTLNNPIVSIYSTDKRIGVVGLLTRHFLSFQSEEVAEEFKKNFESLILEAEEFI